MRFAHYGVESSMPMCRGGVWGLENSCASCLAARKRRCTLQPYMEALAPTPATDGCIPVPLVRGITSDGYGIEYG